ncbi:hypothetical protein V1478_012239 [Vespula squamosa]|uniref:Uncharacterized protein n=1 Tax=Vespula squamosa TaxID=30214 RepID=A0ABD2ACL5_VESSQ
MNDTAFYLHFHFVITSRKRIPWDLRCALVESQRKTALEIDKVVQTPDFVAVSRGQRPPVHNSNLK